MPAGERLKEPVAKVSGSLQGSETILLAEDEPAVRKLVRDALDSSGLHGAAGGGRLRGPAHSRGAQRRRTPVADRCHHAADERARLVKCVQSAKPATKVVYMSGYTDDTLAFHGFSQLNNGFIQKPFNATVLAEKIRKSVGR